MKTYWLDNSKIAKQLDKVVEDHGIAPQKLSTVEYLQIHYNTLNSLPTSSLGLSPRNAFII